MQTNHRARVVVLGAGYAGVLAAIRIARKARGQAEVTLVNDRAHFVERVRLHQLAVGQELPRRSLEHMLHGTGAQLRLGRVTALEPWARQVRLAGGEALGYDYLVYALGSGRHDAPIEGLGEHALDVGSEDAARRVAARLAQLSAGARVTVIGAGLTGIELAAEIAEARPELGVTLVTKGVLGEGLSAAGAAAVRRALEELGVTVRERTRIDSVRRSALKTTTGDLLDSDSTIWCGGFAPNVLARAAGLATTSEGRLALDGQLRSVSAPEIFGAGDGAAIASAEAAHLRMGCATAMPLGAHAADNVVNALAGRELTPFGFDFFVQCISLGRQRGLIQRVSSGDRPLDTVVTGRLAAQLKESVCRFTTTALAMERLIAGTYTWPGKDTPLVAGSTPAALGATIA